MSATSVWFHEDDSCQIELLPKVCLDFARREVRAIYDFSRAHEAPGGVGWTDVYMQKPPPVPFGTLCIALAELASIVPPALEFFEHVTTGYGAHVETAENTVAWGNGRSGLIFADTDSARVVQHVWFMHFASADVPVVGSFLSACAGKWGLILADWAWCQVVDLRDDDAVKQYLELRSSPPPQ